MSTPATDAAQAAREALLAQHNAGPDAPSVLLPIHFELTDADGVAHIYEAIPHNPTDGAPIMWLLVAIGAEPLARLIAGVLDIGKNDFDTIGDLVSGLDLEEIAGQLDWASIGSDIKATLLSLPMDKLTKQLFAHTLRDGKPLSNKAHFDAAFVRNYFEIPQALWAIVSANRFIPPLPTSKEKGNGEDHVITASTK